MGSARAAIPEPTAGRWRREGRSITLPRAMSAEGTSPVERPGGELPRDRSLIADLDAIVWEADARSMRFTFVSEGVGEILGYTPSEWLAEPRFWIDHLHPDDRELAVARFTRAATSGTRFDSEYRFCARDGAMVWLRDLGHP